MWGLPCLWLYEIAVKPSGSEASGVVPQSDFLCKCVQMYVKTSYFGIPHEVQKDLEDISAGIGIFFNPVRGT
jgi:hypothetical protein